MSNSIGEITVIELPDSPSGDVGDRSEGVFSGMARVYGWRGYEAGYRRAVSDLMSAMLLASEEFVRRDIAGQRDDRQLIYQFEAYLQQQVAGLSPQSVYVEGGLGI